MAQVKLVTQQVSTQTTKDVMNYLQSQVDIINKSKAFLTSVAAIVRNIQLSNDLSNRSLIRLKSLSISSEQDCFSLYAPVEQNLKKLQNIYALCNAYQVQLNKFLERKIYLLYYFQTNLKSKGKRDYQAYIEDEVNLGTLYRQVTSGSGSKGSIKNNSLDKQIENIIANLQIEGIQNSHILTIINQRKNAYKEILDEVLYRWHRNHDPAPNNSWYNIPSPDGRTTKDKDGNIVPIYPYRNTFYWGYKPDWNWSKKINRDHIYQAYTHMILTIPSEALSISGKGTKLEDFNSDITTTGDLEYRVALYWDYMQHHQLLNNKVGVQVGDVELKIGNIINNISFAVKNGNFSLAAIGPTIRAAQLITQDKSGTKESVEKIVSNIKPKITQKGQKILQSIDQDTILEMIGEIKGE